LLTLGWSDGSTCVPVSFSLLSSAKEKNRLMPMAEIDKRTNGFKRRAESLRKAPEALKDLVMQARHSGITADYLLFDSWFAFPATILGLQHLLWPGDDGVFVAGRRNPAGKDGPGVRKEVRKIDRKVQQ
jgi:hypothetical protein